MSSPEETPAPTSNTDPIENANFDIGVEPPQLSDMVGVSQDITAAADAATALGGDYAPMVAIALAGMAVAGGSKALSGRKHKDAGRSRRTQVKDWFY